MLHYQEVEQLAHDYRQARLETANQQRLLQSIPQGQPAHHALLQQLTHAIGQLLVRWGQQLQGQPSARPLETNSSILIGK
jgi:hypothetical protein